ncbi:MAG: hypothetical protein JWQ87_4663, partial [Candidatus Sulfotelmatobacter sp.]|nr:hypothetical protein [Candidatus Sulfotelmatobacter sp.]
MGACDRLLSPVEVARMDMPPTGGGVVGLREQPVRRMPSENESESAANAWRRMEGPFKVLAFILRA